MHPYLKHLLSDIQDAYNTADNDIEEKEFPETDLEARFRDIEAFVSGDNERPLKEICGLFSDDFPPADQLTDEEKLMISEEFEHMLESWNIALYIPSEVPPNMRYRLTVDLLEEDFSLTQTGTFHYDFCSGDTEGCELEKYCPCRRL